MQVNDFHSLTEILSERDPDHELLRLNFVFSIFCKCDPRDMIAPGIALLDAFKESFGTSLAYISAGATSSKFSTLGKAGWDKARREIASAAEKELTSLRLRGPDARGPDYSLTWVVSDNSGYEDYEGTNLIEVVIPLDHGSGIEERELWFRMLASAFPIDTGYAAPALMFCQEIRKRDAGEIAAGLALRFPGLDIPNNEWTMGGIGRLSRGARWVTYLSPHVAAKLSAEDLENPPPPIVIDQSDRLVTIIASPHPEIGDVNRQVVPSGLNWIARLLEPVTLFDDQYLYLLFRNDPDLLSRWERRFLLSPSDYAHRL